MTPVLLPGKGKPHLTLSVTLSGEHLQAHLMLTSSDYLGLTTHVHHLLSQMPLK